MQSFCHELERQIQSLLDSAQVKTAVPIQNRAKRWPSIANKIAQGRFSIKESVLELQDLAGLRIILLFKSDVEKVASLIEEKFQVVRKYNTGDRLADNEFGYSSIHMVITLPDAWFQVPLMSDFKNLNLEIQIRTLSQHSWAEASNIFQYKQEQNVPKPLKRTISRISALLETIDLEYERLLEERQSYTNVVKELDDIPSDSTLNADILNSILVTYLPKRNRSHDDLSSLSELLQELWLKEIKTKGTLIELIKENLSRVLEEDKKAVLTSLKLKSEGPFPNSQDERLNKGVYFTHIGLIRTMLNLKKRLKS